MFVCLYVCLRDQSGGGMDDKGNQAGVLHLSRSFDMHISKHRHWHTKYSLIYSRWQAYLQECKNL